MLGTPLGSPFGAMPVSRAASGSAGAPGATISGAGSISGGAASGGSSSIAGNALGASMSGAGSISGGAASGSSGNSQTGTGGIVVPASRTAIFAANRRVVVFGNGASTTINKQQADQIYCVGDVTKDLNDIQSTIQSVTAIVGGVTLLEGPTPSGSLITVKIGGIDTTIGAQNFCTLRVTTASGEQFDRTMKFNPVTDTSQVIGKDPDDKLNYAADFSNDAAITGSAVQSVGTLTAVGVTLIGAPTIQGNKVIMKLSGLDVTNSCRIPVTMESGELLIRTMYFTRVDN
jgi:hypothetical protein